MAQVTHTRSIHLPSFAEIMEAIRTRRARNRVFRQTFNELHSLSNSELADIGIHRTMIRGLAKEAAYGK